MGKACKFYNKKINQNRTYEANLVYDWLLISFNVDSLEKCNDKQQV